MTAILYNDLTQGERVKDPRSSHDERGNQGKAENDMSIQLIQQAINYMEEHIYENINYTDVAKSIHMSNYNFHRTFSFIAGMTANEYIRNRRLTLAAQELRTTDLSVIDAAYKYGYESPERGCRENLISDSLTQS